MQELTPHHKKGLSLLRWGALLLMLAIILGAFGAHGLEKTLSDKMLKTFQTGVTYHILSSTLIMILGLAQKLYPQLKLRSSLIFLILGFLLFCGNCYLYAITQIKTFAMLVPFGGVSFILSLLMLIWALSSHLNDSVKA